MLILIQLELRETSTAGLESDVLHEGKCQPGLIVSRMFRL